MTPFDPRLGMDGATSTDAIHGGVTPKDDLSLALLKAGNAKAARERSEALINQIGSLPDAPSGGGGALDFGSIDLSGLLAGVRRLLLLAIILLLLAQLHPAGGMIVRGIGSLIARPDEVVAAPRRGNLEFYREQLPRSLRAETSHWGPRYQDQAAFLAKGPIDWASADTGSRNTIASIWAAYTSGHKMLEAQTLPQSRQLGATMESYLLALAETSGRPAPIRDLPAAYYVPFRADLEAIRQATFRAETLLPDDPVVQANAAWARKPATRIGTWIFNAGDQLCDGVASAYVRFGISERSIKCVN